MIIKIILLGLCVCVVNFVLRDINKAFVLFVNICYVVIVSVYLLGYISDFADNIKELFSLSSSSGYMFKCLFKGALICILTKLSSDICKESGNTVVSDIVDISGRVMLLFLAFPFIESIVKTAAAFVP